MHVLHRLCRPYVRLLDAVENKVHLPWLPLEQWEYLLARFTLRVGHIPMTIMHGVEAWADGKWYFLGACEPESVLNLGWFNAPASRAMLMHTRVFGNYNGPEEVLLRTNNFTEINLTSNYAPTAEVKFEVKDTDGNPVNGAKVEFKIYNYAEYYTAVTKRTDAQGRTSLSAGKGFTY